MTDAERETLGQGTDHPIYIATDIASRGPCRCCGRQDDLRCGVCFDCSEYVDGKPEGSGHRLWDTRNPKNCWFVGEM